MAVLDSETLTTEQKKPAISVRGVGQLAQIQTPSQPLDSFFADIPDANAPVPKPGQKPLTDYFKDIGAPDTGPVDPNQMVKPKSMQNVDIFKPEAGVDYDTGAPLHHRVKMWDASGEPGPATGKSEQELYLLQNFGPGNFKKDANGQWLVRPNWTAEQEGTSPIGVHRDRKAPANKDRWVAVYPRGSIGNSLAAGGAASMPENVGTAIGTAAGSPLGPVGSAVGAGLGYGAGHLANEGMKSLEGFYDKTGKQLAGDTALGAGLNTMFQGAGPAWNAGRNRLYNSTSTAIQRWTGVTPETRALTQGLETYGVHPPVGSVAPGAKSLEWDRRQRNMTSGDPRAAERAAVVTERIGEVLDQTPGMTPQARARAVSYINDTNVANASGVSGQAVRDAITARNELSQQIQDAYVEDAHRALDRAAETYRRNINGPVFATPRGAKQSEVSQAGNLARGLTQTMEDARAEFGREMNDVASNFHNAAGGKPIVDISGTLPLIEDFLHPTPAPMRSILAKASERDAAVAPEMPPENVAPDATMDEIKAVMQWMQQKKDAGLPSTAGVGPSANDNPIMVGIEEAHKLRSSLMEMVRLKGDTAGIGMRRGEIYRIVHAIDAAMDKTALDAGGTVGAGLRDFNQRWAEGIVRFTNDDVNHILRETNAGRPPDPDVVADVIMNRKSLTATKQIMDMLSPDMRFAVQQADLQNIIKSATVPVGKFGRPTIDPDALIEAISERASLNRVLYGRNDPTIKALEELAVAFKVAGGQVELDSMPGFAGNVVPFGRSPVGVQRGVFDVVRALRAARDEQQAMRREVERDALGALRSNDPKLVDGGVRYILENEARTVRAAEVLGPNSPEWQALQHEAKVEMLRGAVVELPNRIGRTINARALGNNISKLTDRQQQMLLPGSELADMRLLAQQAKMLFPELAESDMGGSLAAASTLGNLPKANAIRRWTWSQVAGYIADSPAVARMLAGTIRDDPYRGRRLLSYLMQYGVNAGLPAVENANTGQSGPAGPSFDQQMRDLKTLESVHGPVPKKGYQGPSE